MIGFLAAVGVISEGLQCRVIRPSDCEKSEEYERWGFHFGFVKEPAEQAIY
jgi:hypothetical protein